MMASGTGKQQVIQDKKEELLEAAEQDDELDYMYDYIMLCIEER